MRRDGIPIIEQPRDELTRAERRANRRRSTRKRPPLVVKSSLEKVFRSILSTKPPAMLAEQHQVSAEHLLKGDLLEDDQKSLTSHKSNLRPPDSLTETEADEGDDENQAELTTAVLAKIAHPPRRRRRTILRKPSGKRGDLLSLLQDGLNVPETTEMDIDIDIKDYCPSDSDDDSDSDEDADDVVFDEYQDEALRSLLRSNQAQLNALLKSPLRSTATVARSTSNGRPRRSASTVEDSSSSGSGPGNRLDSSTSTRRRSSGSKPSRHHQSRETKLDSSSHSGTSSPRCSYKEGDRSGKCVVEHKDKGLDVTAPKRRRSHHTSSRRRASSVKPKKDADSSSRRRRRTSSVVPTAASRLGRRISMTETRPGPRTRSCSRRRRSGRDVVPTNHDSIIKPTSPSLSSELQQTRSRRCRESIKKAEDFVAAKAARSSHHNQQVVEPLQLVLQPSSNRNDAPICSCERASFPVTSLLGA